MEFQTLFMSDDEEKHAIILICHSFLIFGGLSAECVQVSVMLTCGLQGAGAEAPKAWEAQMF